MAATTGQPVRPLHEEIVSPELFKQFQKSVILSVVSQAGFMGGQIIDTNKIRKPEFQTYGIVDV